MCDTKLVLNGRFPVYYTATVTTMRKITVSYLSYVIAIQIWNSRRATYVPKGALPHPYMTHPALPTPPHLWVSWPTPPHHCMTHPTPTWPTPAWPTSPLHDPFHPTATPPIPPLVHFWAQRSLILWGPHNVSLSVDYKTHRNAVRQTRRKHSPGKKLLFQISTKDQ